MPVYMMRKGDRVEPKYLTYNQFDESRCGRDSFKIDGEVWQLDYQSQFSGRQQSGASWPIYSQAAGVHPDQIQEEREALRMKGVRCDFTPDGRAIFESNAHMRKCLKAMNMYDKRAYR